VSAASGRVPKEILLERSKNTLAGITSTAAKVLPGSARAVMCGGCKIIYRLQMRTLVQ